jgi:hypothetical protein
MRAQLPPAQSWYAGQDARMRRHRRGSQGP